jgi:hypothetical protein
MDFVSRSDRAYRSAAALSSCSDEKRLRFERTEIWRKRSSDDALRARSTEQIAFN